MVNTHERLDSCNGLQSVPELMIQPEKEAKARFRRDSRTEGLKSIESVSSPVGDNDKLRLLIYINSITNSHEAASRRGTSSGKLSWH